jgi:hypothetical protein
MNKQCWCPSLLEDADESARRVDKSAFSRLTEMDLLIGMMIIVPDGFEMTVKGCDKGVTTSSSVDVPLSLTTSGRHVRDRSASMDCSRAISGMHPQERRESGVSLPAALYIGGSWEDRFAGGSSTGKLDKGMHLPVKIMRRPSFTLSRSMQCREESLNQKS